MGKMTKDDLKNLLKEVVQEELGQWKMELPEHNHNPQTKPCKGPNCKVQVGLSEKYCPTCQDDLKCPECGAITEPTDEYCPKCDVQFETEDNPTLL